MNLEPLEIDKPYRWSFAIICDPISPSENLTLMGIIRRVEPSASLLYRLENAPLRDRPGIYAEAGIWHDSLASLAGLLLANPKDLALATEWENLLKSMELENISQEAFLVR